MICNSLSSFQEVLASFSQECISKFKHFWNQLQEPFQNHFQVFCLDLIVSVFQIVHFYLFKHYRMCNIKKNLLLFRTHFCSFKTHEFENVLALRICTLTNLPLCPRSFSQTSNSLYRLSKKAFSEQILLRRKARLKGIFCNKKCGTN